MNAAPPLIARAASRGAFPSSTDRATLRQADELAVIFKMLSNSNRLKIIVYLQSKERTVNEMESTLKIRQPTLSQQLGELREAGLIAGRRVAKSAIYALTADRGGRAANTIALASARSTHVTHELESRTLRRTSSQQAAVFASMIPVRKPGVGY